MLRINRRYGKGIKFLFYLEGFLNNLIPKFYLRQRLKKIKKELPTRSDYDRIMERVDFYCPLKDKFSLPKDIKTLSDFALKGNRSTYYIDASRYTRYFDDHYQFAYQFDDRLGNPPYPRIQKTRMIDEEHGNAVLMKLDTPILFLRLKDEKPFRDKIDKVIFRGRTGGKPFRQDFVRKFYDNPLFDIGDIENLPDVPQAPRITQEAHLDYKFIVCLEGNDVASNLKWVMSSNSIAVMPKPTCDSWFMESTLIAGHHYIEVKRDFSDIEEKINYYISHTEEAEQIVKNANDYVNEFWDYEREDIVSLMVLDRYFSLQE